MRIIAGFLAMLIVVGCSDKDNIPSGIIPRDKMEKILWDMVQADQYSSLYLLKDSARINVKTETQKLYQEVFRLHQISREEFRKSFQYYQEHPELARNVFDSILTRGNRLRTESYTRPTLTAPKPAITPPATPPASGTVLSKPLIGPPKPVTASGSPVMTSKPPVTGSKQPVTGTGPKSSPKVPSGPVSGNPAAIPKPPKVDTARGKQPQ